MSNVRHNTSTKYPGLTVKKYKNKVHFDNLWDEETIEARGHVIEESTARLISLPFAKVFNWNERQAPKIGKDSIGDCVRKVNGFLGVATFDNIYGVVYSTTGSTDSNFATMVEQHVGKHVQLFEDYKDYTFLFEICDESDPHIIKEELGAYLIGMRNKKTKLLESELFLDQIARSEVIKRPEHFKCTFSEMLSLLKEVNHEGFMFRKDGTADIVKAKSPYYLVQKFLARKKEDSILTMLSNLNNLRKTIDEEFYPLLDMLSENKELFSSLDEQGRLDYIREFLGK